MLRYPKSIPVARDNAGIVRIFQPTSLGDSFFFLSLFSLLFEGLAEAAAREEKLHLAERGSARRVEWGSVGLTIKDFKSKASLVKRWKRREGWGEERAVVGGVEEV